MDKINAPWFKDSMKTLEGARKYAQHCIDSMILPDHFYGRTATGGIDLSKGSADAVLFIIQAGMEIGLSPTQAIEQLIPMNGRIAIAGDAAKSLILSSGKCESWAEKEETAEGSLLAFVITSKRTDGKGHVSRFSMLDAMRAGLIPSQKELDGKNGYKLANSPWVRFPRRMLRYRALGFLSRDLYPDVLQGVYILEEARDIPKDDPWEIETKTGVMNLSKWKMSQYDEQSNRLTGKLVDKIKVKVNK